MLDRNLKSVAIVAALVVAALVVAGVTDAATRPDDRTMRGPGAVALTNDWVAAESAARPDDRAGRRLPGSAPLTQPTAGDSFDWIDAGIGSAATLGLVFLVAGASVMRLRQGARTA
ncbi:MAG TPA: hypothetical protein VFM41_07965 [Gaiella sp.]|nr:hypothetical protein [Gaiella sp.]